MFKIIGLELSIILRSLSWPLPAQKHWPRQGRVWKDKAWEVFSSPLRAYFAFSVGPLLTTPGLLRKAKVRLSVLPRSQWALAGIPVEEQKPQTQQSPGRCLRPRRPYVASGWSRWPSLHCEDVGHCRYRPGVLLCLPGQEIPGSFARESLIIHYYPLSFILGAAMCYLIDVTYYSLLQLFFQCLPYARPIASLILFEPHDVETVISFYRWENWG